MEDLIGNDRPSAAGGQIATDNVPSTVEVLIPMLPAASSEAAAPFRSRGRRGLQRLSKAAGPAVDWDLGPSHANNLRAISTVQQQHSDPAQSGTPRRSPRHQQPSSVSSTSLQSSSTSMVTRSSLRLADSRPEKIFKRSAAATAVATAADFDTNNSPTRPRSKAISSLSAASSAAVFGKPPPNAAAAAAAPHGSPSAPSSAASSPTKSISRPPSSLSSSSSSRKYSSQQSKRKKDEKRRRLQNAAIAIRYPPHEITMRELRWIGVVDISSSSSSSSSRAGETDNTFDVEDHDGYGAEELPENLLAALLEDHAYRIYLLRSSRIEEKKSGAESANSPLATAEEPKSIRKIKKARNAPPVVDSKRERRPVSEHQINHAESNSTCHADAGSIVEIDRVRVNLRSLLSEFVSLRNKTLLLWQDSVHIRLTFEGAIQSILGHQISSNELSSIIHSFVSLKSAHIQSQDVSFQSSSSLRQAAHSWTFDDLNSFEQRSSRPGSQHNSSASASSLSSLSFSSPLSTNSSTESSSSTQPTLSKSTGDSSSRSDHSTLEFRFHDSSVELESSEDYHHFDDAEEKVGRRHLNNASMETNEGVHSESKSSSTSAAGRMRADGSSGDRLRLMVRVWIALCVFSYLERNGFINVGVFEEPSDSTSQVAQSMDVTGNSTVAEDELDDRNEKGAALGREHDTASNSSITTKRTGKSVIVIGAGVAGLTSARQLRNLGFECTILEARNRAGGRVLSDGYLMNLPVVPGFGADLGASFVTGMEEANPVSALIRQIGLKVHAVGRTTFHLYDGSQGGRPVQTQLDMDMERKFNNILDLAAKLRTEPGSELLSLGQAIDRILLHHPVGTNLTRAERRLLGWHVANLEYANAASLDKLSLLDWDQDDPWEFTGEHVMIRGGYAAIPSALSSSLDIRYGCAVEKIEWGKKSSGDCSGSHSERVYSKETVKGGVGDSAASKSVSSEHAGSIDQQSEIGRSGEKTLRRHDQHHHQYHHQQHHMQQQHHQHRDEHHDQNHPAVRVHCQSGEVFAADAAVVTVPLGVLKNGAIRFEPALPAWKQDAINRMGFGLLNKVILHFPKPEEDPSFVPFWNTDIDAFGYLSDTSDEALGFGTPSLAHHFSVSNAISGAAGVGSQRSDGMSRKRARPADGANSDHHSSSSSNGSSILISDAGANDATTQTAANAANKRRRNAPGYVIISTDNTPRLNEPHNTPAYSQLVPPPSFPSTSMGSASAQASPESGMRRSKHSSFSSSSSSKEVPSPTMGAVSAASTSRSSLSGAAPSPQASSASAPVNNSATSTASSTSFAQPSATLSSTSFQQGASAARSRLRGDYFLFWNLMKITGSPTLLALISGEAAFKLETMSDEEVAQDAVAVLRTIFAHGDNRGERKKTTIPLPQRCTVTRWSQDRFACGSYSFVAVGSQGADYELLARPCYPQKAPPSDDEVHEDDPHNKPCEMEVVIDSSHARQITKIETNTSTADRVGATGDKAQIIEPNEGGTENGHGSDSKQKHWANTSATSAAAISSSKVDEAECLPSTESGVKPAKLARDPACDGTLYFAGEATNRFYPATVHGAILSGIREARRIAGDFDGLGGRFHLAGMPAAIF